MYHLRGGQWEPRNVSMNECCLVISSVHSSKFRLGSSLSASDRLREHIESPRSYTSQHIELEKECWGTFAAREACCAKHRVWNPELKTPSSSYFCVVRLPSVECNCAILLDSEHPSTPVIYPYYCQLASAEMASAEMASVRVMRVFSAALRPIYSHDMPYLPRGRVNNSCMHASYDLLAS